MIDIDRRSAHLWASLDRRQTERRQVPDRRIGTVPVDVDRRVADRRFLERRAEVRRRLNERRHLLT